MTYATSRDEAFSTRIEAAIEDFASQYELNAYSSVPKRTIFLFPGGLGSELMRSFQAYPGVALSFEKVWLDAGIWEDDIPHLKMLIGGIDTEQKYIVPASCVDIPGPAFLHAYEVFIQWCRRNSIDLFVFGWDWRRSVQDAADFFLNVFMPRFDARFAGMTPHPLDHFTFLGHSAGGMVIKAMLNSTANQYVQRVKKAITVATPFYGYGGQILRFLRGDQYLLVALIPRSSSAAIISSLPGGYEYPYLGYQTYLDNKAGFESDPEGYNLNAYPSVDANDPTKVADPYDYDPLPDANGKVRYPLLYGFKSSLLSQGHVTAQSISRPFTAAEATIAAKFFNIRGVQTSNGQDVNETPVGQSWARVLPWFSADLGPDPIQFQMGPGDGTQSAWTARLLGTPGQPDHHHQGGRCRSCQYAGSRRRAGADRGVDRVGSKYHGLRRRRCVWSRRPCGNFRGLQQVHRRNDEAGGRRSRFQARAAQLARIPAVDRPQDGVSATVQPGTAAGTAGPLLHRGSKPSRQNQGTIERWQAAGFEG